MEILLLSMPRDVWKEMLTFHRRAVTVMDQHLQSEFGHGLDDYDVLHQLSQAGVPLRMGDLAERLLVANSSCHRIVSRLADAGFLHVASDENDRRSRLVSLSEPGTSQYRRMARVHRNDIDQQFSDRIVPDDLAVLDRVFRGLNSR